MIVARVVVRVVCLVVMSDESAGLSLDRGQGGATR